MGKFNKWSDIAMLLGILALLLIGVLSMFVGTETVSPERGVAVQQLIEGDATVQIYSYASVEEATRAAAGEIEGVTIPLGIYSGVVGATVVVISGDVSIEEAKKAFETVSER